MNQTIDVREKLVELIDTADEECKHSKSCESCSGYGKGSLCMNYHIADHLIAHGVTVQEWTSVKDRLPELIPCNAGTAYSEAVNVCTDGRKVMVAVWDGIDWLCDMDYWEAWGETITHWTPVLLPLPEPPKGE